MNAKYTATIDLYNNGLVPCVLNMKIYYQLNTNQDIFYLDKYEATIEPLLHKNLGITFAPKALEVCDKNNYYRLYGIKLTIVGSRLR